MNLILLLALFQCVCIAFAAIEVSSSKELKAALEEASPGDHFILAAKTFEGDFIVDVDGIKISGANTKDKSKMTKLEGNTPLTVTGTNVVIKHLVLKGKDVALKMKGRNGHAQSLDVKGHVILESTPVELKSTTVDGDVTIMSSYGKITSNSMNNLKLVGCNNVLRSNMYKTLHKATCSNDVDVTNIVNDGKKAKAHCKWYHLFRKCWWG